MLATGVGATADIDLQFAHQRIGILLNGLRQSRSQIHRFGERQIATVSSGTRDHVVDFVCAGIRQSDEAERLVNALQISSRDPRQHHILVDAKAQHAIAALARDVG